MAERAPTAAERAKWQKAIDLVDRVGRKAFANSARVLNYQTMQAFALRSNVTIPAIPTAQIQQFAIASAEWKKIRRAMSYCESYDLGVRFEGSDFSICAPPNYNADQIAKLNLSGWFLPIIAGIVIVAGVLARLYELEIENDALTAQLDKVTQSSTAIICSDPRSSTCKNWQLETERTDYAQNVSLIDEIKRSLSSVGETAKTGLGWGAAIIVVVLGLGLLWRREA